ncbi:rod shape-determining protein MreC [Candidatus Babeliales bacterium]|nr:rod shape-determining protein MreC [Candidatus Babeliales bacterium]
MNPKNGFKKKLTKKWKRKIILTITIILLFFFILNRIFFFKKSFLENFAGNLIYPVIFVSSNIKCFANHFFQKRKNYKELEKKYKILKTEKEKLLKQNIKLKASLHYNSLTKDILDFQKRYDLKTAMLSKILVKNFTSQEHYFLINKGSKDGIQKNMLGIYKFQIVGKIVDVFRWYSKMVLITDKNCKVAAFTNKTNAQGIVIGQNIKNQLKMDYVNHLSSMEKDDFVISSGHGLIFPEGFCLGKIKDYKTEGVYHKITVEPLVDFSTLKFCLLINQEKITSF